MPRSHRTTRLVTIAAAVFAVALMVFGGEASAHTSVKSSEPKNKSTLEVLPESVKVNFVEAITLDGQHPVRVLDSDLNRVDTGEYALSEDDHLLTVPLKAAAKDDNYTIAFHVVSIDSHVAQGRLSFSVQSAESLAEGEGTEEAVAGEGDSGVGVDPGIEAQPAEVAAPPTAEDESLLMDDQQVLAVTREMQRFEDYGSLIRWMLYAGLLMALGGAFFLAFVHRDADPDSGLLAGGYLALVPDQTFQSMQAERDERVARSEREHRTMTRIVFVSSWVGIVTAVLAIPIQALLVAGSGKPVLTDLSKMGPIVMSVFGLTALLRVIGLGLIAWSVRDPENLSVRTVGLFGVAITLSSFGWVGHPAATSPRWLLVSADIVHAFAAAVWLGGLVLLASCISRRRRDGDMEGTTYLVAGFSRLAGVSVVAAGAAGIGLAWSQLGSIGTLFSTTYGFALLAKLAFVGIVVFLGAYNRQKIVPAIVRNGDLSAFQHLRKTVVVEAVVIMVFVLGLTAVLVTLASPATSGG